MTFPAGDRKTANIFLQCRACREASINADENSRRAYNCLFPSVYVPVLSCSDEQKNCDINLLMKNSVLYTN